MGPEIWVGIAAVFVSGGAIGAGGLLLSQWLLGKLGDEPPRAGAPNQEVELLRQEVSDLTRRLRNLDERLDFQEKLVGGATPTTSPPARLDPAPEALEAGLAEPPPDHGHAEPGP